MSRYTTLLSKSWQVLIVSALALVLAGCAHLPVNGPNYRDISTGATTTLATDRDAIAYDYALVDISPKVIDTLAELGAESLNKTFGARPGAAPALRIGVGDVVQVSIFESTSGGLFIPAEAGVRPGNFVTLPNQTIGRSGTITIPYAGAIRAEGRTATEIQDTIENKLASRAIEPQVVVTLIEQNASTVSIVGDTLNGANKFKISGSGERVLDIISRAGGVKYAGYELFVTLQRQNKRATIHFPRLINNPNENIFVQSGDTIYVYREPQKYVAVGALGTSSQTSGLTGQFTFDQERLSLNEALAKAGGLQDSRANPRQVFLYRMERREVLENAGVSVTHFDAEQTLIPTIYRANFRDPSNFFFAQKFSMRDKDVIYVANSDSTEVTKFLNYVRLWTSSVAGVATDIRSTETAIRGTQTQ
jgi:polysaccharide biosynthesis/export protein